jgi:hypothetical protein
MKFAYKVREFDSRSLPNPFQFEFQFSNLLGTVFRRGNLVFSSDGNSVISPVGNRLTVYDLKK